MSGLSYDGVLLSRHAGPYRTIKHDHDVLSFVPRYCNAKAAMKKMDNTV